MTAPTVHEPCDVTTTSLRLDSQLAIELRIRAAIAGTSQRAIIEAALRAHFAALDAADHEDP